ncbi:hypothetical protein ACLB2K_012390 [Fragaria x ananassa]
MSADQRHIFRCAVVQVPTRRRDIPSCEGKIPVVISLFKETRLWYDGPQDYEMDGERTLVATQGLLTYPEHMSHFVAQQLLVMSVPEEQVPPIIEKLDKKLSVVSDVPSHKPITVLISDVSDWIARQPCGYLGHRITRPEDRIRRARTRGARIRGAEDDMVIATQESIASYKANLTPATGSFIHGLKKLRLDGLEEAVIRKTPTCAICLQDFAEYVEELITCLPCKHYFHVNCIVLCLEINHICSYCRYPMPTLEAGEP